MKPKVNETAVDDEMIDERERKKKTAPFGVIILTYSACYSGSPVCTDSGLGYDG